jgi:acyl-CoA reductase-like NAD-dependent aldehyde dehydrogenase
MRYVEAIEVEMVHVNEPAIGAKETGVGPREVGEEGLNFFSELRTVFINSGESSAF